MITIPETISSNFYRTYTDQLTHKQCVILALYCAEISLDLLKDNKNLEDKVKICIELVKQWLEDTNNVTQEQLRNAASNAASSATWAAAYAAWAASWAWAAAAYAAWAASNAADAASTASWASVYVNSTTAKIKIIPYLSCLISVKLPKIKYNDPLEQLVYYTDQLNLQLLLPIKNGYKLNLWDKSYEYQIEGTIEEIASTTGVKYLLRGIQNDNNS